MMLERNSFVTTNKLESSLDKTFVATNEFTEINKTVNSAVATAEIVDDSEIRQLQLANLPNFSYIDEPARKEKRLTSSNSHRYTLTSLAEGCRS